MKNPEPALRSTPRISSHGHSRPRPSSWSPPVSLDGWDRFAPRGQLKHRVHGLVKHNTTPVKLVSEYNRDKLTPVSRFFHCNCGRQASKEFGVGAIDRRICNEGVEDSLKQSPTVTVQIRPKMARVARDADYAVGLVPLRKLNSMKPVAGFADAVPF